MAILHVDLTHLPAECIPANPLGRPLLNQAVVDISKRRISQKLVTRASMWDGPVILKTDLNFGGKPELAIMPPVRRMITKTVARVGHKSPLNKYLLFDKIADVPDWAWRRKDLVVEKFTPEIERGLYSLRMWIFFGNQGYYERRFSKEPIVKAHTSVRTVYLDEKVPDVLLKVRRQLGFDFGKFDFVICEGEVILLDVNKTPSVDYDSSSKRQKLLAQGISAYL